MSGGENVLAAGKRKRDDGIVVFSILKASVCSACGTEIPARGLLRMEKHQPVCLECADLDHLVLVPSGDSALTRRSLRHSTLSAVVVRFSRTRKRYERQGVLVEQAALERAEQECLDDEGRREWARERAAVARTRADADYIRAFAEQILARYPGCPGAEADSIAQHACQKYSGRVGRSAAARQFDSTAIDLAVTAHVRHVHSHYDKLLAQGWDRREGRDAVAGIVQDVLRRWMSR
jgi:hypothetical protein